MNDHFSDYYWKNGKPYGKHKVSPEHEFSYRIVADPYYKRITVEKFEKGKFCKIIYDSQLLDFRHLKLPEQAAWSRETLLEEPNQTTCLIRNQDDRAILLETLEFEQECCRTCRISSVHGILLSKHRMHYQALNDPFDGVTLYDVENRPIMIKTYSIDPETGEFDQLLSEEWNMEKNGEIK